MVSTIGWLDSSPEEQRRVQEIIRLLSQRETTDELGGRQVFVVLSDTMFPGTSVLQGRARYLLFVPWLCQQAARSNNARRKLESLERDLIVAFLENSEVEAPDRLEGLIGRTAGKGVKQLPSTAYWSGLVAWGVLQRQGTIGEALEWTADDSSSSSETDELAARRLTTWHPGVGGAPPGFPAADLDGGFALTRSEAEWLRERWLATTEGSLLAHLAVSTQPLAGTSAPWLEPLCAGASETMRGVLEDAERFSLALEGAQRLYYLMLCEAYQRQGYSEIEVDVDLPREALTEWSERVAKRAQLFADWEPFDFWSFVRLRNPRVSEHTRLFFNEWFDVLARGGAAGVADSDELRMRVGQRELFLKRPDQSRLKNLKMLAAWRGTPPSPLVYRWPQVQQLIRDVHTGLGVV